jgi:hypothetical protein
LQVKEMKCALELHLTAIIDINLPVW